tara:strand:- start:1418 stop:1651 length:234 start_codon:yes stop_codon:yes gene_type:complete
MKHDLQSIAALCLAIFLIMVTTLVFVAVSQWLAGVAWRLGLVSDAAQWTIYAAGLLMCIGTVVTVAGRIVDGEWWFT